jgi:hypothetical protein
MAGLSAERQEIGLINSINEAYENTKNVPFTLIGSNNTVLHSCVSAEKFEGRSSAGTEPYTDVVIHLINNKSLNLSNKGEDAPSIAGGGIEGLELIIPGLTRKFLNAALKKYKDLGYTDGDIIPDIYGKVNNKYKELIVVGNEKMGGPIDYMYIGPMDVFYRQSKVTTGTKTIYGNEVQVNGELIPAKEFARDHDIYLRLRKRRADQPFVTKETDTKGFPLIMGKSPSRGDKGRRIVTVKKPPLNAIIVKF